MTPPIFRFAVELNWKRKLAIFLWVACILGTFLPTNFFNQARLVGLAVSTIPLLFVWVGDGLSDTDWTDTSIGSLFRSVFGKVLMFFGWVIFARLVGGMVIAPIILKMD